MTGGGFEQWHVGKHDGTHLRSRCPVPTCNGVTHVNMPMPRVRAHVVFCEKCGARNEFVYIDCIFYGFWMSKQELSEFSRKRPASKPCGNTDRAMSGGKTRRSSIDRLTAFVEANSPTKSPRGVRDGATDPPRAFASFAYSS